MFMSDPTLLESILKETQDSSKNRGQSAAIFDLDSTIFNVSTRTQVILRHFASQPEVQQRFPKEAEQLASVETCPRDWGIKDCLQRLQIQSTVDFFFEVRDFWVKHFFSNDFLDHDQPYPGSIEFVQTLYKSGLRIEYLTGRDRPRMGEGTLRVLKKWDLPLDQPPPPQLRMKPQPNLSDTDFKVEELKNLKEQFSQIYFFENEPVIIEQVEQHCPGVNIIFIDTVHSKRAAPPLHLPRIELK